MIKELEGKNIFSLNDEIFKKYFVSELPNEKEIEKILRVEKMLKEFSMKVYNKTLKDFLPKEYLGISYLKQYGYYILSNLNSGYYYVSRFSEDPVIAFKEIVNTILWNYAIDFERESRSILIEKFKEVFSNLEYNQSLVFSEYAISKWMKYYDEDIPRHIIKYYENYLNDKNNYNFEYDFSIKKFILKEKRLIK